MLDDIAGQPDKGSTNLPGRWHIALRGCLNAINRHHEDIDYSKLKVYCNIRNPFERLVSIYEFRTLRHRKYDGFKGFFYNCYVPASTIPNGPIYRFITLNNEIPGFIKPIMFTNIRTQWPKIIKKHFNVDIELPWHNKAPRQYYKTMQYFDNEMIKIVLEKDQLIIKKFFPMLKEKYARIRI
jgi:hypothetical protein